jgi:hypothetical protein
MNDLASDVCAIINLDAEQMMKRHEDEFRALLRRQRARLRLTSARGASRWYSAATATPDTFEGDERVSRSPFTRSIHP